MRMAGKSVHLRRLLELVAKKHSPEYAPVADRVSLEELGLKSSDMLLDVDLSYAYLRGLAFPPLEGARLGKGENPTSLEDEAVTSKCASDVSSTWCRSNLEDAVLQEAQDLLAKLCYSRLFNAELREGSLEKRLREIADRKNLREISDPKAATPAFLPAGHAGGVNTLALLPNGLLASGGDDGAVRIWEVGTGWEVRVLEGYRASVRALAALPGGLLASGGDDGVVRIWEVKVEKEGEEEVKRFNPFRVEPSAVFVQADSRGLLICAPSDMGPWRTRWVDGEELPADPLLHEVARFVYEGYVLPLYRIPSRFEWAGPEGEKTRCIRLLWPEDPEFDWRRLP